MTHLLRGMVAGAAGTTALNTVTYLDMAIRKRPGSTTPEQTVERIEKLTGTERTGSEEQSNHRSGMGALMGIATGVGTGALYGLARARCPRAPVALFALGATTVANLGSVLPKSALRISDPREWSATSWVSDVVPHLAYGIATAVAYDLLAANTARKHHRIVVVCGRRF